MPLVVQHLVEYHYHELPFYMDKLLLLVNDILLLPVKQQAASFVDGEAEDDREG